MLKQRTKIHAICNLQNDITFLIFGVEKKFKLHMKGIFKLFPTVPVLTKSKEVNIFCHIPTGSRTGPAQAAIAPRPGPEAKEICQMSDGAG